MAARQAEVAYFPARVPGDSCYRSWYTNGQFLGVVLSHDDSMALMGLEDQSSLGRICQVYSLVDGALVREFVLDLPSSDGS